MRTIPFLQDFVNVDIHNLTDKNIDKENGRGSWTRTNGCQDQNLMPYQLGDTPIFKCDILLNFIKKASVFF